MGEDRPSIWIGHIWLRVSDAAASHDFYVGLGMRPVMSDDGFAIAELRGGTHLLLSNGEAQGGEAPFDLMVEDVPATHTRFTELGLDVSPITTSDHHDQVFVVFDPDGYEVKVYDDHTVGPT